MLNQEQKQVIILSSFGGLLEYYDFTVYGLFVAYFADQFFPSNNTFMSIIASYVVFVLGYVVRPLGGILFSHIGDEIGRKPVMILTMVLMGIASLGLGLCPTYAQIGIWAPILLLMFRLIQGLAIGGELPSVIVYVAESIPNQRGLAMGGIFSGTVAGLLPGILIELLLTHYLTINQINNFGWRIPFIIGGLLCVVAYYIRSKLHETQVFKKEQHRDRFPIVELLQHHFIKVLIGIGLISIMGAPIMLAIIFMPTYLTKIVKIQSNQISHAILIATCISIIVVFLTGALADKFNVYKLLSIFLPLIVIAASICYYMIAMRLNLIIAVSVFAVLQGTLNALPPILLSYIFPVHVRLSGVALSYNISSVTFGGMAPLIITGLIEKTGLIYLIPVLYLLVVTLIAAIATVKCSQFVKLKRTTTFS